MSLNELCRHIGQNVTIFTTSGGTSGCGFSGMLIQVNPCFVTLVNRFGSPPSNPLSESICSDLDHKNCSESELKPIFRVGSVCDIPVDKIACFTHNAI